MAEEFIFQLLSSFLVVTLFQNFFHNELPGQVHKFHRLSSDGDRVLMSLYVAATPPNQNLLLASEKQCYLL
ncbi:hypothetical protein [Microcoleus asticus]|uniref:Uncharacterized protein n=1 Tax=Microcoleus asticus IPMA8 TaxID=2563858 RepID=A0ABX2CSZ7_9CYAN|nr:hypothetical protein [Microcoleus asticus]NQE33517.1 hypothetical protein [Microcoleus asticus IPMA8]